MDKKKQNYTIINYTASSKEFPVIIVMKNID